MTLRGTVDFEQEGKQIGVLWVPDGHNNDSAWGSRAIPIACLRNGDGPSVLLLAGNHGDEYEGQIALRRLAAETDAENVHGTLILLPCLSPPAARTANRLWPDGSNFNRIFPGSSSGSAPELLADYLSTELFPRVDVVGDFHSGGRSLLFPPMATMHIVEDRVQRGKMLQAGLALNTDWLLVYADMTGDGLLPGEAERQRKIVVTSELGGAGMVTTASVEAAYSGIANLARHLGVLSGEAITRPDVGKSPTRIVRATDIENYVLAPVSGLLEPVAALGAPVVEGDALVRIYAFDELEREPTTVVSPAEGLMLAYRSLPMVERGDCVALVCEELDPQELFRL